MIDAPTDEARFASLAVLKAAHSDLLQRRRTTGDGPESLDAIAVFIERGQVTGVLLDDNDARETAQSLLTYWANLLYRAGREPPDSTLADFDPLLAPDLPDALCPYLGLDAFREEDYEKFFGRRELIARLIERLADHRLLAVVGPSGSGKSSLVRAGLIPALKAGALPGSQDWHYLPPIVPGSDPLAALNRVLPDKEAKGQGDREPNASNLLVSPSPCLLVVDQFEELWTLCDDEGARQAFIARLLELVESSEAQHRVVLTMRSDFETFVARAPQLQALFEVGRVQVTPLSAAELREAIERPAEAAGLKFEAGVVDLLLQDLLGEPAGLPLLQFTLLKLWERRDRNRVTRAIYDAVGGGRLALARSADEFYAGLIPEEQVTARRILLRMVRPGEGLEITSSRVRREDLLRGGEDPGRVERVLEKLIEQRLVRLTAGKTPGDTQIEVAHEALVRNWPALADWLEEEKAALATRRRLEGRAAEWVRLGQGDGGLLDEVELREAERWLNSAEAMYLGYDPALPALVRASRATIEAEQQEKEAWRQRELDLAQALATTQMRTARRLRRIAIALLVLLAFALIATSYALVQRNNAQAAQNQTRQEALLARAAEAEARREAMNAREAAQREATVRARAHAADQRETAAADLQISATESFLALNQGDIDRALLLARSSVPTDTQVYPPFVSFAMRHAFEATVRNRPLIGQNDWVTAVAWSPNGQHVLTASKDQTARVWDATTGNPVRTLSGHTGEIWAAAWSPNGQFILTGSADKTARVWDATTGNPVRTLSGHTREVRAVAWSPDGRFILTGSADKTARVWDATTGNPVRTLSGHTGEILAVAWSPDGQQVLTGSSDQTARLWDSATGQFLQSLVGHTTWIWAVAWSPDGRQVLTGSGDQTARLWKSATGELVQILVGHTGEIWGVAWSPDGRQVLTGSQDRTARIWDAATGKLAQILVGHTGGVTAAMWSPDGQRVLTGSADYSARIWDVATGVSVRILIGHTTAVGTVAWSLDGRQVLTGSNDQTARIWDAITGKLVQTLKSQQEIRAVAWRPDGRQVLIGSADGTVRLWDTATGQPIQLLTGHTGEIRAGAWSPDGRQVLTSSADKTARIWDPIAGKPLRILVDPATGTTHTGEVLAVAWSPDGGRILTGSADHTARVWDATTGDLLLTLKGHTDGIGAVAWSPDGQRILTGSADSTARVWDATTGDLLLILEGHTGGVSAVAWSQDGQQILTGGADKTVRLWDNTGQLAQTLEGDTGEGQAVAWSPDGRQVLTGSSDGTARVSIVDNRLIVAELTRRICYLLSDETISKTIPDWRGCLMELAAVDPQIKEYDTLRGGR